MAVTLELIGSGDTLDLNGIDSTGSGIQAIAGAGGFGLPPVDIQITQGAGTGGSFRGFRGLPRDVDLPLHFLGTSEANLASLVSRFSRMMRNEVTLRATSSTGTWTLVTRRVGGGDFIFGKDRDQRPTLDTVVTLRAAFPYWASTSQSSATAGGGSITLNNTGDVEVSPIWEITNPSNIVLTSAAGEELRWTSSLSGTLTINTSTGRVTGPGGTNQYEHIGAHPEFWQIPVGSSVASVSGGGTIVCKWNRLIEMVI